MLNILQQQYDWVRSARQNLFAFLEEIPTPILHSPVPAFGRGTIIRTHLHVVDTYRWWLGAFASKKLDEHREISVNETADVKFVREWFANVDERVQQFLYEFDNRWSEPIEQDESWQGYPKAPTPLLLITHLETHEFHHKGQIVSMARNLGYPPPADDRLGGLFS
ncbi:damage-inducible protein DinB [Xylanibacillus composti]|uniref:DNA damage-inducible protein DinB n=1 Tax=Xylanibacillus composti TaxID=1572762 RepID=A0A8J4H7W3_9BACL|nr:DinB family protein [Xylanibacillus composti]MDT9725276.1 damage-inducible protein DinB [Xylanibacillus composti]GIQ70478.1 DNA damage-inducible protein DinB [Xylanibacillus composti]